MVLQGRLSQILWQARDTEHLWMNTRVKCVPPPGLHGGAVCSTQSPVGGGRTTCREDRIERGECGSGARYLASEPSPSTCLPPDIRWVIQPSCASLSFSADCSRWWLPWALPKPLSYLLSGVSSHRDPWLHSCSSLSRKALCTSLCL